MTEPPRPPSPGYAPEVIPPLLEEAIHLGIVSSSAHGNSGAHSSIQRAKDFTWNWCWLYSIAWTNVCCTAMVTKTTVAVLMWGRLVVPEDHDTTGGDIMRPAL